MHDYRAIFLDIDGTLTQPGHSAPPVSAVAAIESARRLGRRVFLCTGRCEAMLKPLLHCADFDGYVASSGGLVVVGSRDVFDCPMTPQEQAHVLTALSDNGVFRTAQTRMGAYCDEGFRDFLRARDVQNGSSELLRWREAIEQRLQMQPMRDYGGEPVYSVVCMSPTRAQLDKAMAECSEFDFVLMDDRQHDLVNAETANRRYDKGSGVKQVCAAIGVDPADSICFGDSLNDLPMFGAAGFSVCMGNGGDAAKQQMELDTLKVYFEQLPKIAAAIGDGYANVGEIKMFGDASGQLANNIMNTMTQVTEGVKSSTGLDINALISGLIGGKVAAGSQKDNNDEDTEGEDKYYELQSNDN